MLTKTNYDNMREVAFVKKSRSSESRYFMVSFGVVRCAVRVSDHRNKEWNSIQVIKKHPEKISHEEVAWAAWPVIYKVYGLMFKLHQEDAEAV